MIVKQGMMKLMPLVLALAWLAMGRTAAQPSAPATLTGRVTGDGVPLSGVYVSDGVQIVATDADGYYGMASDKARGTVFVITPSGYVAESRDGLLPAFYAHLTAPADRPEQHDFTLRSEDQSRYGVILVSDMHLANDAELDDQARFRKTCMPLIRRAADALRAEGPVYSFHLGDLSYDKYWVKDRYTIEDAYATLCSEGWPTLLYNVPGNHDNDGRVSTDNTDFDAGWLYRKVFGPEHYSLDIGGDHWIVMDDILYQNPPGKPEKRAEGMAGNRDYGRGFTPEEMAFLRADLALQPDGKRIFLCTHCPLLTSLSESGDRFDDLSQMREIDALFARFGSVRVFAGHTHQTEWCESEKYPHIKDLNVGALSGNAWSTAPGLYGKFGCGAGVVLARFAPGRADYSYEAVVPEEKGFRVYDMNEVSAWYAAAPGVRDMVARVLNTVDYADEKYRDLLLVNDWFLRPGDTLEAWESCGWFGRKVPLAVERVEGRDPLFDLHFFLKDGAVKAKYKKARTRDANPHLFTVRTSGPRTKVTLRVRDASGAVLRETVVRRPVPFRAGAAADE